MRLTTDTDFLLGLRVLAFEAAKRYVRDPRASLCDLVDLLPGGAHVRLRTSAGEMVHVHVAYSGVCSTIPSELFDEDEDELLEETQELAVPREMLTAQANLYASIVAERGNF